MPRATTALLFEYRPGCRSLDVEDGEMMDFLSSIYRETRYLEGVSVKELSSRLYGLVLCLITQEFGGPPLLRAGNGRDAIALVELLEEFRLRAEDPYPQIDGQMNRLASASMFNGSADVKRRLASLAGRRCLFRYTERKYVDDVLAGRVRFRRASSYNDPSFNVAVRDNELEIRHVLRGLRMTNEAGRSTPVMGNAITARAASDYYVSCFSLVCEPKLFAFFGVDACVGIVDGDRFREAVFEAHDASFPAPASAIASNTVEYVDQFRQFGSKRPIEFRKNYDFACEREYRFASIPRDPSNELGTQIREVQIDGCTDYVVITT